MKKMTTFLVVALLWGSQAWAEKQPILPRLPEGQAYPISSIVELIDATSKKSVEFLKEYTEKLEYEYRIRGKGFKKPLTSSNVKYFITHNLNLEEIQLRAGIDKNSLWDDETNTIDPFTLGNDYDGLGYVHHDYKNNVHFPMVKANCINFTWRMLDHDQFEAPEVYELEVVSEVEVEKKAGHNVEIYDTNFYYTTVYRTSEEIYEPLPVRQAYYDEYYPSNNFFNLQMWIPIYPPQMSFCGGQSYSDNSYYNNSESSVINNYYNTENNNYYQTPDPIDPGGPAPAPGHDDIDPGGPVPVPGHTETGDPTGAGGFDETSGSRRGNVGWGSAKISERPSNETQRSFKAQQNNREQQIAQRSFDQRIKQREQQIEQRYKEIEQRSGRIQNRSNQAQAQGRSSNVQTKNTPNPGYRGRTEQPQTNRSSRANEQRSNQPTSSRYGQTPNRNSNSGPKDYNRSNGQPTAERYRSGNVKSQPSYNNGGSRQNSSYTGGRSSSQNMGRQQFTPRSSAPRSSGHR